MRLPAVIGIALLFLFLSIGFNLYFSFNRFNELVYPLDDAYIHMAISKNLQQHGVWGVTRHQFSSTSSSILFTLLFSAMLLSACNAAPVVGADNANGNSSPATAVVDVANNVIYDIKCNFCRSEKSNIDKPMLAFIYSWSNSS